MCTIGGKGWCGGQCVMWVCADAEGYAPCGSCCKYVCTVCAAAGVREVWVGGDVVRVHGEGSVCAHVVRNRLCRGGCAGGGPLSLFCSLALTSRKVRACLSRGKNSSEFEEAEGLLPEFPWDLLGWEHGGRGASCIPQPPSGLVLLQGPSQDCPPPEGFGKEPLHLFPA